MDKKIRKLYELAVKYIPGPRDNPGLKYIRKEMCLRISKIFCTAAQLDEVKLLLKKIDE